MALTDLVVPQAVVPSLRVNSKKQALQELAIRAAAISGRGEREVLEVLMQRERLGSTGIGSGIAIPHGKLARLERLFGVFARLERPIDFDALDGQPVPRPRAQITSKHLHGLPGCCGIPKSPKSSANRGMLKHFMRC
jgi:nitrogen PTS system EIIA component